MEQNNLIVTPDGKSWDEVTRDVSYLGNCVVNLNRDGGNVADDTIIVFDLCRGQMEGVVGVGDSGSPKAINWFNKDWAIAYDRLICLKTGTYNVHFHTFHDVEGTPKLCYNSTSTNILMRNYSPSNYNTSMDSGPLLFSRGDYIVMLGPMRAGATFDYSKFYITREK